MSVGARLIVSDEAEVMVNLQLANNSAKGWTSRFERIPPVLECQGWG